MNKKINSLAQFRKRANVSLNDVAVMLNINASYLSRIEKGIRKPTAKIILLYHILFDAPITELFSEQFNTLKKQLQERSQKLIDQLKTKRPPKSLNRIKFFTDFVNSLGNRNHE